MQEMFMLRLNSWLLTTSFVSFLWCSTSLASSQAQIDAILTADTPPFGVVFEVVEGDRDALEWAIPQIIKYATHLRKKFPDIGIAVVSHGKEQFALMTAEEKDHKSVHNSVKSLVQDQNIPVHVCGTHASWYDKKPEDFPNYVDVAPAGPTAIANYEDMGYEKIVLEEPN